MGAEWRLGGHVSLPPPVLGGSGASWGHMTSQLTLGRGSGGLTAGLPDLGSLGSSLCPCPLGSEPLSHVFCVT